MTQLKYMVNRNIKLFFKDKGLFFTSLITPLILLVLYATFLGNVYRSAFEETLSAVLPNMNSIPKELIEGSVGGQLFSSLLAVCTITVSFCSNMLMVQDKVSGALKDLTITPVKNSVLAFGYYLSTLISSLTICLTATVICLIYISFIGWYLSLADILFILLDVFILVMFGTALSSIINYFLTTQGQISAVGSMVSSVYGFICGAYMPISQFPETLQKVLSFLPGTYGTALLRNHAMRGVFSEMENLKIPTQVIDTMKDTIDCNIYCMDNKVSISTMYLILTSTVVLLIGIYIIMNLKARKVSK